MNENNNQAAIIEQTSQNYGQRELQSKNQSFFVQIVTPQPAKQSKLPELNLMNPQDKALSLVYKMMKQRKDRQQRQIKLMQQIHRKQQIDSLSQIGEISRIIEKQIFMSRQSYLREQQYQAKPKKVIKLPELSKQLPKIIQDKKTILKRQLNVLSKSKQLTIKYEGKKIITELLEAVIYHAVELYEKKKKFYFRTPPNKISQVLAQSDHFSLPKRGKKYLNFSRVIDISIQNQDEDETQNQSNDEEQHSQSEQVSSQDQTKKQGDSSDISSNSNQNQSNSQSQNQQSQQQQQGGTE